VKPSLSKIGRTDVEAPAHKHLERAQSVRRECFSALANAYSNDEFHQIDMVDLTKARTERGNFVTMRNASQMRAIYLLAM
jgi:hypothetical protein